MTSRLSTVPLPERTDAFRAVWWPWLEEALIGGLPCVQAVMPRSRVGSTSLARTPSE
jgi:hypothetical protein